MKVKKYLSIEIGIDSVGVLVELVEFIGLSAAFDAVDGEGFKKFIYLESLKSLIDDYCDDAIEGSVNGAILNAYNLIVEKAIKEGCELILFYNN